MCAFVCVCVCVCVCACMCVLRLSKGNAGSIKQKLRKMVACREESHRVEGTDMEVRPL